MRLALWLAFGVVATGIVAGAQVRPVEKPVELPAVNLPPQPLGPNDLVAIHVYGTPELSRTVRLNASGEIRLPMLNAAIPAAGKLPGALEPAIAEAIKAEQLLVAPVVTVTVVEYHSRPVSVVGAVKKPTTFQAFGSLTLLDALARAEGVSADAGPHVLITRKNPEPDSSHTPGSPAAVQQIDLQALISGAQPELNVALTGGEEIRVPEAKKVYVVGNVRRPGAYPVHETGGATVLRIVALAEGLAPHAAKTAFLIRRGDQSPKREMAVELAKILERKSPDVPLEPDDILYVPDSKGRRVSLAVLERVIGFGSATASGVLVWGASR